MGIIRCSTEQIIRKRSEAEVEISNGSTVSRAAQPPCFSPLSNTVAGRMHLYDCPSELCSMRKRTPALNQAGVRIGLVREPVLEPV